MADIFISHSTKDPDPGDDQARLEARAIRDGLYDALKAAGHAAILDKRSLKPGDDWYAMLHRWLGQCHGGVVIVDPKGLRSNWLRKESLILSWRSSQVERFRLITVLVGGVTHKDVGAVGLDDLLKYQTIKATNGVAATIAEVVARFDGFVPIADHGPMARWIRDAARLLEKADGPLDGAARCLGLEELDLTQFEDTEVTIAHALLHATPDDVQSALRELLSIMPSEPFRRLVRQARPVCVDAAAGAALHLMTDEPPREAIINVANADIGRVYVDRARLRPQLKTDGIEIDCVVGEGGALEIEHALREALLDGAAQNKNMPNHFRTLQSVEEQDRELNTFFDRPEKFFLLLGPSAHGTILGRLRPRMSAPTFILLTPSEEAAACAAAVGASIVEPRLDPAAHMSLLRHLTELANLETE